MTIGTGNNPTGNRRKPLTVADIEPSVLSRVAGSALGLAHGVRVSEVTSTPAGGVHNDARTLEIVQFKGWALVDGSRREWSAVAKVIDRAVDMGTGAARWTDPDREERVYAERWFADLGLRFRPARCYGVDALSPGVRLLWLEDLSGAPQPPWSVDQYVQVAADTGEFDGYLAVNPIERISGLPSRGFLRRWGRDLEKGFQTLAANRSSAEVSAAFNEHQVERILQFAASVEPLLKLAAELPLSVSHGDSHARNLFPAQDATIAIDWSGLALEPVGTSLGVLLGSALTWSAHEATMVLEHFDEISDAYEAGLRRSDHQRSRHDVRLGFFAQFIGYLCTLATIPAAVATGELERRRAFYEARLGIPLSQLPHRIGTLAEQLIRFVDEAEELAKGVGSKPGSSPT